MMLDFDLHCLETARANINKVYEYNYVASSKETKRCETILNKLDELIAMAKEDIAQRDKERGWN